MEGNHTLFSQGANTDQSDIPTRASHGSKGPPEKKFNRIRAQTTTINKWTLEEAQPKKEKVGGPTGRPADLPMGPTASSLRRGSSSLDGEVGSRGYLLIPRPRRGWLPTIYMRGGAPFQDITKHPSNQVTLSRCSSSSLVEVLGLEEFGFES